MLSTHLLLQQWEKIAYKDGGFLRVDTPHSLEIHLGYNPPNQKVLLLVSKHEIGQLDSSLSIEIRRGKREIDNHWTLSFQLLRSEQANVFAIFCSDMINYSSQGDSEAQALDLVFTRYKQWVKLLEGQSKGVMSVARQKGLVGELLFLKMQIEKQQSPFEALKGWFGAEGGDQDFVYGNSWYEVKTIGVSALEVAISSIEQLDAKGEGALVVMRVDSCSSKKSDSFSLNNLVSNVEQFFENDASALCLYRAKLAQYGYISLQEYDETHYFFTKSQIYTIIDGFPRLCRESIPSAIGRVQYSLNIAGLNNWER